MLSACEGGVIGDPTPDEAIGLPAALMAAGANGVIAASWAVDDLMATTLFSRFWATWSPSDHPAQHLGRVQHWLRQVTNDELADEFRAHRNRRRSIPASARRLWNTRRPYRSSVHWAAFGYHVA
ncbi:MAG TPA: CHAT domain-containing protein [Jiangellaceae bacterium]|nr:CHAT domain-containing protein [Jiangellaceae bacterium]